MIHDKVNWFSDLEGQISLEILSLGKIVVRLEVETILEQNDWI